jgi:hypothetical protein
MRGMWQGRLQSQFGSREDNRGSFCSYGGIIILAHLLLHDYRPASGRQTSHRRQHSFDREEVTIALPLFRPRPIET